MHIKVVGILMSDVIKPSGGSLEGLGKTNIHGEIKCRCKVESQFHSIL